MPELPPRDCPSPAAITRPTEADPALAVRPFTVLVLEDGPAESSSWQQLLAGLTVAPCRIVHRGYTAGLPAGSDVPDLALLALHGAVLDGLAVLSQVSAWLPDIPLVVLGDREDEAFALQTVRLGAQDYLPRSQATSPALVRALRLALERHRLRRPRSGYYPRPRTQEPCVCSVFDKSPDGLLVIDGQGAVRYANPAARLLFHDRGEELVGSLFDHPTLPGECRELELAGKQGGPVIAEMLVQEIVWEGRPAFLASLRDITPHKRRLSDLELVHKRHQHQASHDVLTGLPNRQLLYDRLHQAIALARRHDQQVAVLFLDLDGFKQVNDTLGHPGGDELLRRAAQRLRTCVRRASDTVARLGGDEFTIVLGEVLRSLDFALVAQKILRELARPFVIDNQELFVSASIGIALYPADGLDCETLVHNADLAMYRAKRLGKNNCQLFETSLDTSSLERLEQENDLRKALDREELVLHYQPQFDLGTEAVLGVEALVRWQHPERGLVAPADFMPLAETMGLATAIDRWVLQAACLQNRLWQDAGYPPVCLFVNLSLQLFREQGLAEGIARTLEEIGLPPQYLAVEITESHAMHNMEQTITTLRELDQVGVQLSIANFGFGYSSLNQLKCFPIDVLKIDRSLVRPLPEDNTALAIIRSIVDLGHGQGWKVFAEGVESPEQLDLLRAMDCDGVQGFYCGRPLPHGRITNLLQAGGRMPRRAAPAGLHYTAPGAAALR